MAFSAADVRATAQQLTRVTHRQRLGDGRQCLGRQVYAERVRALAEQGGDAVPSPSLFGLQLRYGGFDPGQARIGTHHVEVIAHAGIAQGFGNGA